MSVLCSDANVTHEWLEERKRDVQKMGKWSVWVPELHKYRAKYKQDEQEKTSSQLHYHQKFVVSEIFEKKWILLFSKDALNWSKVTVKTI